MRLWARALWPRLIRGPSQAGTIPLESPLERARSSLGPPSRFVVLRRPLEAVATS